MTAPTNRVTRRKQRDKAYDVDFRAHSSSSYHIKRSGGGKGPELSIRNGITPKKWEAARVDLVSRLILAFERHQVGGDVAGMVAVIEEMQAAGLNSLARQKRREL